MNFSPERSRETVHHGEEVGKETRNVVSPDTEHLLSFRGFCGEQECSQADRIPSFLHSCLPSLRTKTVPGIQLLPEKTQGPPSYCSFNFSMGGSCFPAGDSGHEPRAPRQDPVSGPLWLQWWHKWRQEVRGPIWVPSLALKDSSLRNTQNTDSLHSQDRIWALGGLFAAGKHGIPSLSHQLQRCHQRKGTNTTCVKLPKKN